MSGGFRYAAFVSYSSRDAAFARRLHRALEAYEVPKALGSFDLLGEGTGKKNRIYPVFRDREELAAGHLAERIEASLRASAALVVVCSPNAAASPWVQKEIEFFLAQGRADRIFAIIAEDATLRDASGADATGSCFPPAFRADALSGGKLEPLAADARKGKDGFRNAYLKVVSGLVGVTPGQLIDRDRQRRGRQRLMIGVGAAVGMLAATIPLAWQDTARWRENLTRRAGLLREAGDQSGAMTFALAGENIGGALMPARAADADALVRDLAGLTLMMRLNSDDSLAFSEDGKSLQTFAQDGTVTIFDLEGKKPSRVIGKVDRSLGGPQGYWPFASRFPRDREGWVIPEGLDAEIIRLPMLNVTSWQLNVSKPGVKDPKAIGAKLASVLPGFDKTKFSSEFDDEEDGIFFSLGGLSSDAKAKVEALGLAGVELIAGLDSEFPKSGGGLRDDWLAFPDVDGVLHVFDLKGARGRHRAVKFAEPVSNLWVARDTALVQGRAGGLFAFDPRGGAPVSLGTFAQVKRVAKQVDERLLIVTVTDDLVLASLDAKLGAVQAKAVAKLDPHVGSIDDSATGDIVKLADGDFAFFDMFGDNRLVRLGKHRLIEAEFVGEDDQTIIVKDVDTRWLSYFDLPTGKGGPFATPPEGHIHAPGGGGTTMFTARYDPKTEENGLLRSRSTNTTPMTKSSCAPMGRLARSGPFPTNPAGLSAGLADSAYTINQLKQIVRPDRWRRG